MINRDKEEKISLEENMHHFRWPRFMNWTNKDKTILVPSRSGIEQYQQYGHCNINASKSWLQFRE